jgi:hypothetical protein
LHRLKYERKYYPGFPIDAKFIRALRRAGIHYFEHEGHVIWELGQTEKESAGKHVHQFLIKECPRDFPFGFPLSAKQLTPDELKQLETMDRAAIVGKQTLFAVTTPAVTSTKAKQGNLNRRRKANQARATESDILTLDGDFVSSLPSTATSTSCIGAYYAAGYYSYGHIHQPQVFGELEQMWLETTSLHSPYSPSSESCDSPELLQLSMSECDGLDESLVPILHSNLDSVQYQFQNY